MGDTKSVFPDFIASGAGPSGVVKGGYELLLETVDVRVDTSWQYMRWVVTSWRPWMYRAMGGARMVCAGATITGQPGRLVHLWRVPPGFSTARLFNAVSEHSATPAGHWLTEFTQSIERVTYEHEAFARAMTDHGVKPEFEIFDAGMMATAHRLLGKGPTVAPAAAPAVPVMMSSPGVPKIVA